MGGQLVGGPDSRTRKTYPASILLPMPTCNRGLSLSGPHLPPAAWRLPSCCRCCLLLPRRALPLPHP